MTDHKSQEAREPMAAGTEGYDVSKRRHRRDIWTLDGNVIVVRDEAMESFL